MDRFLLYFRFEPYLAQWYIHEMGGTSPVELPRGSVESDILRLFLTKRPDDVPVDTGQDANLAIVIPAFKEKEAITMLQNSEHVKPNDSDKSRIFSRLRHIFD